MSFALIIQSFSILFKDFRLLLLSFLPGILSMFATVLLASAIWEFTLEEYSLWISVPVLILLLPIFWILLTNISLLFAEDAIIDRVQELVFGKVRIPAPSFSIRRVYVQILSIICVALFFLLIIVIQFFPILSILSFLLTAWLTAWIFLFSIYNRESLSLRDSIKRFFKNIASNTLLGMTLNFLLFVPILNVFLVGYAVTLSTLLEMKHMEGVKILSE